MKINEILTEAPIDQLLAQEEPAQTGQQRDASGRYATQVSQTPKLDKMANAANATAKGIKKVAGAIASAPGKSYGSSFVQPEPVKKVGQVTPVAATAAATEPAPTVQPGVVAPENAKYIRAVAQNKVTSQGTGTPEIDAMLRSAGVLKP